MKYLVSIVAPLALILLIIGWSSNQPSNQSTNIIQTEEVGDILDTDHSLMVKRLNMGEIRLSEESTDKNTINPREYQIEFNEDGSVDIYDGDRKVGHLNHNGKEPFHKLMMRDNQ